MVDFICLDTSIKPKTKCYTLTSPFSNGIVFLAFLVGHIHSCNTFSPHAKRFYFKIMIFIVLLFWLFRQVVGSPIDIVIANDSVVPPPLLPFKNILLIDPIQKPI
jgi:hypothetical protein